MEDDGALSRPGEAWERLIDRTDTDLGASRWMNLTDHVERMAVGATLLRSPDLMNAYLAAGEQIVEGVDWTDLSNPSVAAALERAAPGVDPEAMADLSDEALEGLVVLARGSLGEISVLSMLDEGELPLPEGAVQTELAAFTEEGHDLIFTAADGELVNTANVKIASSARAITDHFDAHPEVPIVYASSDAVADLPEDTSIAVVGAAGMLPSAGPVAVDIDVSSGELGETVLADLASNESVDAIAAGLSIVPVIALTVIALRGARRWVRTNDDSDAIRLDMAHQSKNVLINSSTGTLVAWATGLGHLDAPVTIATALTRSIMSRAGESVRSSHVLVSDARDRLSELPPPPAHV